MVLIAKACYFILKILFVGIIFITGYTNQMSVLANGVAKK